MSGARKSSDGLYRAVGFVVVAVVAAGVVAALVRGRPAPSSKSPLAKGSTPPRHIVGIRPQAPEAIPVSARFDLHRVETSKGGWFVVYGVTTNTSELPINPPEIVVVFKDEKGVELAREASRWPIDLDPGVSVPTRLAFAQTPVYESLEFEVRVTEKVGLPAAKGLAAEGIRTEPGRASWTVSGRVHNRGQANARWIKIVLATYGDDGKLLRVDTRSVDVDPLEPGKDADFSLRVFRADVAAKQPRFEATAYGREG